MAPSPSTDPSTEPSAEASTSTVDLTPDEAELLLDIADAAIDDVLAGRSPEPPAIDDLPPALRWGSGAFVTLTVGCELNGCIGTLGRDEALGRAVARLAVAAAVDDPRLPRLTPTDRSALTIDVSLLSPLQPIDAVSWNELRAAVRPARDGVVLEAGRRRGLFLPSVWEQLPDPEDFLDQLYLKAGLRPRTWPRGTDAFRFSTRAHSRSAPSEVPPEPGESVGASSEPSVPRRPR